jgi:tRNA A37 threonylcarbamoyltransferase TsaD
MDRLKFIMVALLLSTGAMTLSACNDGPLEEAGEAVDDAVDDVKDAVD